MPYAGLLKKKLAVGRDKAFAFPEILKIRLQRALCKPTEKMLSGICFKFLLPTDNYVFAPNRSR